MTWWLSEEAPEMTVHNFCQFDNKATQYVFGFDINSNPKEE